MTRSLSTLALLFALPAIAAAGPVSVTGGKTDQANVVCTAALPPGEPAGASALKLPDGTAIWTQPTRPSLLQKQDETRYVTFVLPKPALNVVSCSSFTCRGNAVGGMRVQFCVASSTVGMLGGTNPSVTGVGGGAGTEGAAGVATMGSGFGNSTAGGETGAGIAGVVFVAGAAAGTSRVAGGVGAGLNTSFSSSGAR